MRRVMLPGGAMLALLSASASAQVAQPVIFSALTTMLAFAPLMFIDGPNGDFMMPFPLAVIVLLLASLLESLCLLPGHLYHIPHRVTKERVVPVFLVSEGDESAGGAAGLDLLELEPMAWTARGVTTPAARCTRNCWPLCETVVAADRHHGGWAYHSAVVREVGLDLWRSGEVGLDGGAAA